MSLAAKLAMAYFSHNREPNEGNTMNFLRSLRHSRCFPADSIFSKFSICSKFLQQLP